jgi:protein arginine phosphatase
MKKLNNDAVFLHHTGSMFGVGCSAFNEKALMKINVLKGRHSQKGFIALLPEASWLEKYDILVSSKMGWLLQQYWPGELTVILPDTHNRFGSISVDGQVAFRVPTSKFLRDFIVKFNTPIISTSVNNSGEVAETNLKNIRKEYANWFDSEILPKEIPEINSQPSTIIKEEKGDLSLVREGELKFSEIERSWQTPRILFVCTANICRSPMAHYYLQKIIEENQLRFEVRSAGFLQSDVRISQNSYQTLQENGIDAAAHISTRLNDAVVSSSWLILTMTKTHKLNLIDHFPNAINKTFTLSEYAGYQQDIDDPYGLDIFHYRQTYQKIKKRIDVLVEKLNEF